MTNARKDVTTSVDVTEELSTEHFLNEQAHVPRNVSI